MFCLCRFAAKLIAGVLDFKRMIDRWVLIVWARRHNYALILWIDNFSLHIFGCSETLPVEYLGGKPLCMDQYYKVLSSCRIPGPKKDTVANSAIGKTAPTHITVVHNFQVTCCTNDSSLTKRIVITNMNIAHFNFLSPSLLPLSSFLFWTYTIATARLWRWISSTCSWRKFGILLYRATKNPSAFSPRTTATPGAKPTTTSSRVILNYPAELP